ncbi:uncharacterized protein L201_000203 [Kwoniella dendrophila CBS 6074]|uniref:Uncharacterized protein n=1 Tax=Kwoniella dendrophila CBS 6074 TaxID=1295534 RepID=A0AAX4JLC8_9TREE
MNRFACFAIRRASSSRASIFTLPISRNQPFIRSFQTTSRTLATSAQAQNGKSAYAKRMEALLGPRPTSKNKLLSNSNLVPLQQPWPWHEIPNRSSSDPEIITLQRTLFARPPDLSPPLLLFAAGIWGLFVFAWLILPDPPKKELTLDEKKLIEENERKAKEANIISRLSMGFTSAIFSSAQPLIYGIVTVALIAIITSSTRIITRINMVQTRFKDTNEIQKTILRLTNVGHEMIPFGKPKFREVKVEDCQVYLPNLNNSHAVRLRVLKNGQINKNSLDRFPYSLDYRAVPENTRIDKEVVQSTNRLQHVFGPVKTLS